MKYLIFTFTIVFLMGSPAVAWPGGTKAAVSFSYDDGRHSHLDTAMADLEHYGFRGTFYINSDAEHIRARVGDWRRAFKRGHEVGDHLARHFCDLSTFTPKMIRQMLDRSARWLNRRIGIDRNRTFAYPCGNMIIGDGDKKSYKDAIARHYIAARTVSGAVITKSIYNLPSYGWLNLAKIKKVIDRAVRKRGWAILRFHGIGTSGDLDMTQELHRDVADYVAKQNVWVAPVGTVVSHLESN